MDEQCEWEIDVVVVKRRPGKERTLMKMTIKFGNYDALVKSEDALLTLLEHFQSHGSPLSASKGQE